MPLVGSLSYGWSKPDAAEVPDPRGARRGDGLLRSRSRSSSGAPSSRARRPRSGSPSSSRARFRPARSGAGSSSRSSSSRSFPPAPRPPSRVRSRARPARAGRLAARRRLRLRSRGLCLVTLFVILGAHAAVTVARLRSPWVALDLLLAPALVFLAAAFFRDPSCSYGIATLPPRGSDVSPILPIARGAPLLAACLVASFVQVAEGRIGRPARPRRVFGRPLGNRRRRRRRSSARYAGWVASARATDLVSDRRRRPKRRRGALGRRRRPARRGRGAPGSFLFDAATGRSLRVRG